MLAVFAFSLPAQEFGCCSAAFTVDEVAAAARRSEMTACDWAVKRVQARAAVQPLMTRWDVKSATATVWNASLDAGGSIGPPPAREETSESAAVGASLSPRPPLCCNRGSV